MAYRDGLPPAHNMGAVIAASLKAGLVGASIYALFLFFFVGLPSVDSSRDLFSAFGFSASAFVFCLVIGTLAIALCISLFGLPIAYLARRKLASGTGVMIALISAVGASGLIAGLFGGWPGTILILPFSIPAAIYFRREILLESLSH